jgi:hypothetical protein
VLSTSNVSSPSKSEPKSSGFDISQYTGYIVGGVILIVGGGIAYFVMKGSERDGRIPLSSNKYEGGNYMYYPYL